MANNPFGLQSSEITIHTSSNEHLVTVYEAARQLGKSRSSVYRYVKGELRPYISRIGRRIFIPINALQAFHPSAIGTRRSLACNTSAETEQTADVTCSANGEPSEVPRNRPLESDTDSPEPTRVIEEENTPNENSGQRELTLPWRQSRPAVLINWVLVPLN